MFSRQFTLNEESLAIIRQFGEHMPGGFFLYKADENEELLYANKAVCDIFGCSSLEEFKEMTGFTFRGMIHPEDCERVSNEIRHQIANAEDEVDHVEYRIVRKDGEIRWIDDYGHYVESDVYRGLYYVFISDITDQRLKAESDKALRTAVIEALTLVYDSVWMIHSLETQRFELLRIDKELVHTMPASEAMRITRFSDAFTIKNIFTGMALSLIMDISMVSFSGVILFRMNPSLFSILFFMTIISILLVFIFKHPYKKINEEQMQQSSVLNSEIIEGLRAVETIKANAGEDRALESLERQYVRSLRIGWKEGMLSNVQGSISSLISGLGNLILLYTGIMQVMNQNMTLGSYMAFMTLSGYFMDPIGNLVSLQLSIQEAGISMKRLSEILGQEKETGEGEEEHIGSYQGIQESLVFRGVTFRYGNRRPALENINLTIQKGQKVALVGGSGSGKSTMAKLLLKYYEPETGEILVDGVSLTEFTSQSVRRGISYVPQNIELFSKSIFENIRMGKPNATLEEVKEAAKAADAHEFIKRLPLQYHTWLEEAGNGLSGGEKQRLALARALIKNNDFYIVDEGTSNLDFATENTIFDMIYRKFAKKTMLIIAHRLATIKNCDKIVVLEKGRIAEEGTHQELIEKQGIYYRLWEMQQGNFTVRHKEEEKREEKEEVWDEDEISYT